MKRALIAALILMGWSSSTLALCKYRSADGSWTYAKTCSPVADKEINQSASMVLQKTRPFRNPTPG